MSIPFEEIKETRDRDWSERLFQLILTAPDGDTDADEAVDALSDIVDPRLTDRLFAVATNVYGDPVVRVRALQVICDSGLSLEGEALREWWRSGDPLLQKEAIEHAFRTEVEYLRPVLDDPFHPLHRNAVAALEIGFDDPQWTSYVVTALSHFDPDVRKEAVDIAIWDEPVAAQPRLIEIANNEDGDIAWEAVRALTYFRSRESLRALSLLVDHADSEVGERASEALRDLATEFQSKLDEERSETARAHLVNWMNPVMDLVALHGVQSNSSFNSYEKEDKAKLPLHGSELAQSLSDVSGKWIEKERWIRYADWSSENESDRKLLASTFVNHPDLLVRQDSTKVLSEWGDSEALVKLANDRYEVVRKSAIYWLSQIPKDHDVADIVRPLIDNDLVGGTAASEALETWLHHTNEDSTALLVDLALHDTRSGVRWTAINRLAEGKESMIIDLLNQPVGINWALHSLLLEYLADAGIKPAQLESFTEIDDLYIASACADLSALKD